MQLEGGWHQRRQASPPEAGRKETESNVRIGSTDQAGRSWKIESVPTLDPSEEPRMAAVPLVRFESTNEPAPQVSRGVTNRVARPWSTGRPGEGLPLRKNPRSALSNRTRSCGFKNEKVCRRGNSPPGVSAGFWREIVFPYGGMVATEDGMRDRTDGWDDGTTGGATDVEDHERRQSCATRASANDHRTFQKIRHHEIHVPLLIRKRSKNPFPLSAPSHLTC